MILKEFYQTGYLVLLGQWQKLQHEFHTYLAGYDEEIKIQKLV